MVKFLTTHSGLIVCALFLLAGAAWAGDYGASFDEGQRRQNAIANFDYILGKIERDDLPPYPDRLYGVSFELPLLLAERALGLEDYYQVHRLRLVLTHLFFIAGAFCCYLLVYRLWDNRLLALLALLIFLLHPRLYAHSFFNSKDLPFLSMLSVVLYLLERAFRRDTAGAFALLGVAAGILTDLRIMGIMLFPAVLAMRGIDLVGAARRRRKHILVTAGLFALAAGLTPFALLPYAWSAPWDYLTGSLNLTVNHPATGYQLFQGEQIFSTEWTPHYALVWFVITGPPLILLLGVIGAMAVAGRGAAKYRRALGNTRLRIGILLVACFVLPLLAVALSGANIFNDWRHLYFIYVPFGVLAAAGLHWLAVALRRRGLKAGAYGLAGAGMGLIILQMAQIHPHQQIYFNFLVDRSTPGRLQSQYELDYWRLTLQDGLKYLLERHPGESLSVMVSPEWAGFLPEAVLPQEGWERLAVNSRSRDPDYDLVWGYLPAQQPDRGFNAIYSRYAYNNTVLTVKALDAARMTQAAAAAYRELYRQARETQPIIQAYYDIYRHGNTLTFIRENCRPGDRKDRLGVKVYPGRPGQPAGRLPDASEYQEFYNLAVGLDGRCLAVIRLPEYPIEQIIVGQGYADELRQASWEEGYSFEGPGLAEIVAAIRRNLGQTALRATFEVFLEQDSTGRRRLIYYKSGCSRQEYETRFHLHIYPANAGNLPLDRRELGFANRDFYLAQYGSWPGGDCLAVVPLPDYFIAEIRTGQSDLWAGRLYPVSSRSALRAIEAELADTAPDAQAHFDLYIQGNRLIYRRETCTDADTAADFFLHIIPADADNLAAERQPHGFDNRDFSFAWWGGRFDGNCLAAAPLPDYPIAEIRTGQYTPGQGQLWAVELAVR